MIKICILVGPTASGKTRTSIAIAKEIDAEIISADSMAIYRGMDIGTAKPTEKERSGVPHHLIDICDPWEMFNVGNFVQVAAETIEEIHKRGRNILIVGGTPLYIKALLEGICESPPADWKLREELQSRPAQELYQELCGIDPKAAEKISVNDIKRIVRALEIFYLTKIPISEFRRKYTHPPGNYQSLLVGIRWPREILYRRIEQRVDLMWQHGFIEETKRLLELPKPLSKTASKAIGYYDIIQTLQGNTEETKLLETVKRNTRRFAKRQMTWWKQFPITWLDIQDETESDMVTAKSLQLFKNFLICCLFILLVCCEQENNSKNTSVNVLGHRGVDSGLFNKPRAVAVSPKNDDLIAVDITGRVQTFHNMNFISVFNTPKIDNGRPTGLGFTNNGDILVADTHYHRVLCYNNEGKMLFSFGEYGTEPHQFVYVTDVTMSPEGIIYVTEYGGGLIKQDCVKMFTSEGKFIARWGTGGTQPGEFDRPMSIAIDNNGNILVADACNHRIQKFSPQGKFIQMWGKPGENLGELSYPYGIAVAKNGDIYVSEFGNNRIQKFSSQGESLGCFGHAGRLPGMFANPWDIAVSAQGEIYVADALNHRVQKLSPKVFSGISKIP